MTDVLRGQDFVLEAANPLTPTDFFIIAAQSQTDLDGSAAVVDVSNKDVNDNFRRIGNNMGEVTLQLMCNGILVDDDSHAFMLEAFTTGLLFLARTRNLTTGKFSLATWKLSKFKYTGTHQQDLKYNYTLDNDGPITNGTVA